MYSVSDRVLMAVRRIWEAYLKSHRRFAYIASVNTGFLEIFLCGSFYLVPQGQGKGPRLGDFKLIMVFPRCPPASFCELRWLNVPNWA